MKLHTTEGFYTAASREKDIQIVIIHLIGLSVSDSFRLGHTIIRCVQNMACTGVPESAFLELKSNFWRLKKLQLPSKVHLPAVNILQMHSIHGVISIS